MITWLEAIELENCFSLDFYTEGPYLLCSGIKCGFFQEYGYIHSCNIFHRKHSVYVVFCRQADTLMPSHIHMGRKNNHSLINS